MLWEVVTLIIAICLGLALTLLLSNGVGRWLMAKAGVENPPKKWWLWWRALWLYIYLLNIAVYGSRIAPDPGLAYWFQGFATLLMVCLQFLGAAAVLMFVLWEIGYQLRSLTRPQSPTGTA